MKARQHTNQKIKLPDGSIVSVVIWVLPEKDAGRPHRLKYRLNYCVADGSTLVRYDNEHGKGDHKHLAGKEEPYQFQDIDTLLNDFWKDVDAILEKNQHE